MDSLLGHCRGFGELVTSLLVPIAQIGFELPPRIAIGFGLIMLDLALHHGVIHVHHVVIAQDTKFITRAMQLHVP